MKNEKPARGSRPGASGKKRESAPKRGGSSHTKATGKKEENPRSKATGKGGGYPRPKAAGKEGEDRRTSATGKEGGYARPKAAGKEGENSRSDATGRGGGYSRTKSKGRVGGNPRAKAAGKEEVRLNKYIAAAGICSRREADDLIKAGLVTLNGKVVTEMGVKVKPGDDVRYNGERMKDERKMYLVLNKPKDYVTTMDDPHATRIVMDLIRGACKERIYPVGRLDRTTTGILLFTNDGDLAKKLTHPSYNKKKIYHVYLDQPLKGADMNQIAEGIELEDGLINADAIAYPDPSNKREVGIEIHSGRNRIIRRIFEKLGYKVLKLDRVYFAGLTKKNLPRGKYRFLTPMEIRMLKSNAFD